MGDRIEIYDILLVTALVGTAWKALFGREAFTSTVFFVVYGLLMAMAWVQLGAIDVALAEASIGAGLTGALLIGAIQQFEKDPRVHFSDRSIFHKALVLLLVVFVFLGMITSISHLQAPPHISIYPLVMGNLSESGSTHPVTAVLLNFRAFDTWLELGVLLLASVAAITIHKVYDQGSIPKNLPSSQDQPRIIARVMLPLLILIGGLIFWYGSRAPGGAFQAGALIGAAGILLQLGGQRSLLQFSSFRFRLILATGFFAFIVTAGLTFFSGRNFLQFPVSFAGAIILVLELAATLSIALTLNVMYACSHPWQKDEPK